MSQISVSDVEPTYGVERQPCVWISLKDSVCLAAKLWIPVKKAGNIDEKFPAILGKPCFIIMLRVCDLHARDSRSIPRVN